MSRSTVPSKRPAEAQEAAWIADEDRFVLQQAKKKAVIRAKGGRAQPIDWLAAALIFMDPATNGAGLEEELEQMEDLTIDPESIFDELDEEKLLELRDQVQKYLALEKSKKNIEYWSTMNAIATDRLQRKSQTQEHTARGVSSVSSDLDQLLGPKNLAQLEKLERQVNAKLDSGEPVDTDYWEYLLKCLSTYKAHAKLRMVTAMIVQSRLDALRRQQATEAELWQAKLVARGFQPGKEVEHEKTSNGDWDDQRHSLDPEPMLRLRTEDKRLRSMTGEEYAREIAESRRKITKQGFVPNSKKERRSGGLEPASKRQRVEGDRAVAQGTSSLFDREVARGLGENEEFFTIEEPVATKNIVSWSSQYRPRKPKFFNRMQLGYEWNKYNQTHYDADNPPPKIVQGYKFNIFYPDLADKTRAPTYRIERENGRRRGQVAAPAGETDTCLIRFTAGPPYEDVAFRIVDREWDFSAKRERGFKSLFEKGILQLHFQFKKIYYRK